MNLDKHIIKEFLSFQKNEITESIVYTHLATIEKDSTNQKIMQQIALEEKQHYEVLKCYTGQDIRPDQRRISKFVWLARLFGVTFAIKLMESSEISSYKGYARYPEMADLVRLAQDEEIHEAKLIGLINEERLEYMGSVVLGLNDALVEFTGALAGFTLALSDSKLIALTGSITGIAAALSMASSEYLSTKSESSHLHRHCLYHHRRGTCHSFYYYKECDSSTHPHADNGVINHRIIQLLLFSSERGKF